MCGLLYGLQSLELLYALGALDDTGNLSKPLGDLLIFQSTPAVTLLQNLVEIWLKMVTCVDEFALAFKHFLTVFYHVFYRF